MLVAIRRRLSPKNQSIRIYLGLIDKMSKEDQKGRNIIITLQSPFWSLKCFKCSGMTDDGGLAKVLLYYIMWPLK
eukprot:CCRYP_010554-RA/>CCRYP_010554-RA protein AED:0.47 eAED:0.47 QI:60/1/1/1/0/0/2/177/74